MWSHIIVMQHRGSGLKKKLMRIKRLRLNMFKVEVNTYISNEIFSLRFKKIDTVQCTLYSVQYIPYHVNFFKSCVCVE
jgi:hypothetical protein